MLAYFVPNLINYINTASGQNWPPKHIPITIMNLHQVEQNSKHIKKQLFM